MRSVPKIPDSTMNSLHVRLTQHAQRRRPALTGVRMHYRAGYAYVVPPRSWRTSYAASRVSAAVS
jgi:hypothetical protein